MKQIVKPCIIFQLLIMLIVSTVCSYTRLFDFQSREWTGTESIRSNNYEKALFEVLTDTLSQDTTFRLFKLGYIHKGLKNWNKSIFYFRITAQKDSGLAPLSYEQIGEIEIVRDKYENAIKSYNTAANMTKITSYRRAIFKKMYTLASKLSDTISIASSLQGIKEDAPTIHEDFLHEILIQFIESTQYEKLDSTLLAVLGSKQYKQKQCFICQLVSSDALKDSVLSTETLFQLSKLAYRCKDYGLSSRLLHKTIQRHDFETKVSQPSYLFHRAFLNYKLRNYYKVIKWALKYDKKFGSKPELLYIIARSYRNLGKSSKASYWYDKHIQLFPRHKKTQDILWYRAWIKEDAHQLPDARNYYEMIFRNNKNRAKADQAHFRYALTFCKEKEYQSSLNSFLSFLKRYPYSNLLIDAQYWIAKSYYALNNKTDALTFCNRVIDLDPTNYYAYRSREMIYMINDSLPKLSIDTLRTIGETIQWLNNLSSKNDKSLDCIDSLNITVGTYLAALGMIDHSEYFLKPFQKGYPKNLLLSYHLARFYKLCNEPTLSYHVARYLAWRIPSQERKNMPKSLYTILYPDSYMAYINKYSAQFKVDPALVSSIIRQESIFNPIIESPVGAIGLMQIMPYTGEEIARDLKEKFSIDSLYSPEVNIRYGTYYIRKVLNIFKDDFVLAIASYNGGPHNAKRWRTQNSEDEFDMFVEDIGFSETRKYIKKVLGNYWTYTHMRIANVYP